MTPDERLAYVKEWAAANPDKVKKNQKAHQVRKRAAFQTRLAAALEQEAKTLLNMDASLLAQNE